MYTYRKFHMKEYMIKFVLPKSYNKLVDLCDPFFNINEHGIELIAFMKFYKEEKMIKFVYKILLISFIKLVDFCTFIFILNDLGN